VQDIARLPFANWLFWHAQRMPANTERCGTCSSTSKVERLPALWQAHTHCACTAHADSAVLHCCSILLLLHCIPARSCRCCDGQLLLDLSTHTAAAIDPDPCTSLCCAMPCCCHLACTLPCTLLQMLSWSTCPGPQHTYNNCVGSLPLLLHPHSSCGSL
jgi:hypothetical protein